MQIIATANHLMNFDLLGTFLKSFSSSADVEDGEI
jgi:hypothetical protein